MRISERYSDLGAIYADSVLLHYALFDRMLEAVFDPQERTEAAKRIVYLEFDSRHDAFYASLEKAVKAKHGAHLAKKSLAALKKMKVFKVPDVDAGFALRKGKGQPPFSEIASLHNASAFPNIGTFLMDAAVRLGGRYLECFGAHLSKVLHATCGFNVYHSIPNIKMRDGKFRTLYFMKYKDSPIPNQKFKEMYARYFKLFG